MKLTTNERKILNKKMCAVSKAAVSGAGLDYDTSTLLDINPYSNSANYFAWTQ